ncbi:hypothetical protein ACVWXN_003941 [Bradyrhizobium sp. i1.4.4]
MTSTSSVDSERWTSTLSITTWKNSGETSAKNCRKNEAASTSPNSRRYLPIAPMNQVISKWRPRSESPARRAIRISPPSQIAHSSSRSISTGRWACGDCTSTLSAEAFAMTMKLPSRSTAIAGSGLPDRRLHCVR